MKKKQSKLLALIAGAAFLIALLLNVSSGIKGELTVSSAYAQSTGTSTGTATKDPKFKYKFHYPTCSGVRMCKGRSVSYTGTEKKCTSGTDLEECDDTSSPCVASFPCPS